MSDKTATLSDKINGIYRQHEVVNIGTINLLYGYVYAFNDERPADVAAVIQKEEEKGIKTRFILSLRYLDSKMKTDLFALEIDRNDPINKKYFIRFLDGNTPQNPVPIDGKDDFKRLADEFIASSEFDERLKKDYDRYLQSLATA